MAVSVNVMAEDEEHGLYFSGRVLSDGEFEPYATIKACADCDSNNGAVMFFDTPEEIQKLIDCATKLRDKLTRTMEVFVASGRGRDDEQPI
jgi:hypothetical protein